MVPRHETQLFRMPATNSRRLLTQEQDSSPDFIRRRTYDGPHVMRPLLAQRDESDVLATDATETMVGGQSASNLINIRWVPPEDKPMRVSEAAIFG